MTSAYKVRSGRCVHQMVIATVVRCYRIVSIFDWLVFDIVCDPGAWIYVERRLKINQKKCYKRNELWQ